MQNEPQITGDFDEIAGVARGMTEPREPGLIDLRGELWAMEADIKARRFQLKATEQIFERLALKQKQIESMWRPIPGSWRERLKGDSLKVGIYIFDHPGKQGPTIWQAIGLNSYDDFRRRFCRDLAACGFVNTNGEGGKGYYAPEHVAARGTD